MARDTAGIPGSNAEEMGVLDAGVHKLDACAPLLAGLYEDIQVNTGEIIGLGTRNYELVQVKELPLQRFLFPPDPRPAGVRLRKLFSKTPVFPFDRHDGTGFLREEDVDLDYINAYYDNTEKLTKPKS